MNHSLSDRVALLGLNLPQPGQPIANYVNYVISQNQLFISGQIPLQDGKPAFIGRLGDNLDEAQGAQAAELAALGLLAQLGHALEDDLSRLARIVRLGVFVASHPDFQRQGAVANGASNLLVNALGDKGRHARSAVGVSVLPTDAAVEIEGTFEVS